MGLLGVAGSSGGVETVRNFLKLGENGSVQWELSNWTKWPFFRGVGGQQNWFFTFNAPIFDFEHINCKNIVK